MTKAILFERDYRHPLSMTEHGVSLYRDATGAKVRYIVRHDYPAGEDVAPSRFFFATLEQAQAEAEDIARMLTDEGLQLHRQRIGNGRWNYAGVLS